MAGNGRKNAQATLIACLAAGKRVQEAAEDAGIGERTAYRWLADPAFKRAVDAEKAAMIARATAMLADASTEAVATLRRLLQAQSETAQLGAARSMLELGVRLRDSQELEARIVALEELANNRTQVRRGI
ncbi:MAG: hypothetical protein HY675_17875 [Chloroflexi bacterium]|nr:hypothetical protein [Chloroflexota bacterium]